MKFKKIDIIVPLVIIAVCLVAIVTLSIHLYKSGREFRKQAEETPIVHYYDYIIEVDGTDSMEVYTLYNCEHQLIGSCTSNNIDSLSLLIMEDNL